MNKFTKFSLMLSLWVSLSCALSFNYQDLDGWTAVSPLCGNGKLQSPIDLGPTAKTIKGLPLDIKNYAAKLSDAKIFNAGYTVKITGNWGNKVPTVIGALLNNTQYLLGEVHVHWSEKDNTGTDHSINGKRHACEVHFVHYNSKYGNMNAASKKADGFLVIGLLYKVNILKLFIRIRMQCYVNKNVILFLTEQKESPNLGLQALSNLSATVKEENSKSTGILDLSLFGIEGIKSFYWYAGSLTAPPCSENVLWVVANEVFPTNAAIMKQIRSAKLSDDHTNNVRPIQALNKREVILYKK